MLEYHQAEPFSGFQGNWEQATIEEFQIASQTTRVLRSFYWSLATMTAVGTEDYYPKTDSEVIFQVICTLLGASVYASFIGNLASLLSESNSAAAQFRQKMEHVKHYMGYRQLPMDLRERVLGYYEYLWSRHSGLDENVILNDLPNQLRLEVSLNVARKSVQEVFNAACGAVPKDDFTKRVVQKLKTTVYSPGDTIVRQGEFGNDMFFVNAGHVEVINEDNGVIEVNLRAGKFFGEKALLSTDERARTVRAATYCDLFQLQRQDLEEIFEEYPEYLELMLEMAEKDSFDPEQKEKYIAKRMSVWKEDVSETVRGRRRQSLIRKPSGNRQQDDDGTSDADIMASIQEQDIE